MAKDFMQKLGIDYIEMIFVIIKNHIIYILFIIFSTQDIKL